MKKMDILKSSEVMGGCLWMAIVAGVFAIADAAFNPLFFWGTVAFGGAYIVCNQVDGDMANDWQNTGGNF